MKTRRTAATDENFQRQTASGRLEGHNDAFDLDGSQPLVRTHRRPPLVRAHDVAARTVEAQQVL